jgi:hypothetical protein
LRSRTIDTGAEMRLGDALVLGGMMETHLESELDADGKIREHRNEIQTIVLITPKRVDERTPIAQPPVRASYMTAPKGAAFPNPMNFGGVTPRFIQQEEEERLIDQ